MFRKRKILSKVLIVGIVLALMPKNTVGTVAGELSTKVNSGGVLEKIEEMEAPDIPELDLTNEETYGKVSGLIMTATKKATDPKNSAQVRVAWSLVLDTIEGVSRTANLPMEFYQAIERLRPR